jgi:hypothetical protein
LSAPEGSCARQHGQDPLAPRPGSRIATSKPIERNSSAPAMQSAKGMGAPGVVACRPTGDVPHCEAAKRSRRRTVGQYQSIGRAGADGELPPHFAVCYLLGVESAHPS